MEPSQSPPTGSGAPVGQYAPGQIEGEPPKPTRKSRWRSMRRFLVVGLCAFALLGAGVAAAGALYYDRATKPDLGTPDHVARKYLEAYLEDRDEQAAKVYQCGDGSGLSEIRALRDDIDSREKQYNITVTYSVGGITVLNTSSTEATVSATLVLTTAMQGQPQRVVEHWQLTAHNDHGWHVCSAHETT